MEDQLKNWLKTLKLNESTISMILGGLVVVVVGILIYNYFTGVTPEFPELDEVSDKVELVEEDGKLMPKGLPTTHTVAKGEDLWSIAERYYSSGYNWVDIARENQLLNPNHLLVGQQLSLPRTAVITPPSAIMASEEEAQVIEGPQYEVVKGDSLWSISVRAYQDGYRWPEIAAVNKNTIADPNVIEVGMRLTLPR